VTASIAELARAFDELPTVFMTAKDMMVNASATTNNISISENPCSAVLLHLLIPELLGFHPVTCPGAEESARTAPPLWIL
jgi:hypothetical protein